MSTTILPYTHSPTQTPSADDTESKVEHKPGSPSHEPLQENSVFLGARIEGDVLVVDWDGPNDIANPRNWSTKRRWLLTGVLSAFSFITALPSSMIAPGTAQLSEEFNLHNRPVAAMVTSIFVLAFAFGPLLLGPLSEILGRAIILQAGTAFFFLWNMVCGFAQSTTQILAFRFLAGLGASAPLATCDATLGDMWSDESRGRALAIFSLMPLCAPVLGPIIGSWIAEKSDWRWIFWSSSIVAAVIQLTTGWILSETYHPVILERKAKMIRKALRNSRMGNLNDPDTLGVHSGKPIRAIKTVYEGSSRRWQTILSSALTRPFALFIREPIIQVLGIYFACIYGLLYLFLTTVSSTFKNVYGQSLGISGLNYIALGIGLISASQVNAHVMNPVYKYFKAKNGGVGRPEFRLPSMVPGTIFLPIGILLTGWSFEHKVFWLVPDIGLAIFGIGMILNFQSIQIYIVDAFPYYAASALAAVTCLRCLAGFGFPLFAPTLFSVLGHGRGNTILACVATAIGCPAPWLLWRYGERLRQASRYNQNS